MTKTQDIKKLRKFGLTLSGIFILFIVIGLLKKSASILLLILLIMLTITIIQVLFIPKSLKYPENFLLKIGKILGFINTRIILTLMFYIVFTPIALIMRILRKKTLEDEIDKNSDSYWIDYKSLELNESYKRQF